MPDGAGGDRRAEGRFALYSVADAALDAGGPATAEQSKKSVLSRRWPPNSTIRALTLAQLRARLQSLDVEELEALLAYEEATKARAPFQTLLANRITRANAK